MKKIGLFLLSILTVLSVMIPIGGIAAAEQADTAYTFPAEYSEKLDSRYVKLDIDKLDACLYALLNYNGEVEYRLVVEQAHEDHTDIGLMPVTLQHAVVHDEDQPEILITVHPDKGFIEDEWFLTSFSKQLKKQAKKGKLTVETEFGDIVFDLDNMQKKAKKDHHRGKTPPTEAPDAVTTEAPATSPTSAATNKPSGSETPANTPKPTKTPSGNTTPKPTQKPTNTPKPTSTPKPDETPNDDWFACGWCDKWFKTESECNSHISQAHPKCSICGARFENQAKLDSHVASAHASTPTPTPTPTSTPTPTPTNTPAPTPSGHYEQRWVVDKPEQGHSEWVCNGCGHHSMSEGENTAHQKNHVMNDEPAGWHVIHVTDSPEEGHWEEVWVPDP